jgi:hypothetical protein
MSLNVRAIATLGIGFGAVSVAYLGLWPVADGVIEQPVPIGAAGLRLPQRIDLRDSLELLQIMPIIVEVINAERR